MHLLDGGFPAGSYFKLQTASTYLADFHPVAFALIDLSAYRTLYLGKNQLKDELTYRFYASHPFLYKGDAILFLHAGYERSAFDELVDEFHLKVVITEGVGDLYDLPALYRTTREALDIITDEGFHSGSVFTVADLAVPVLLNQLRSHRDLIAPCVKSLAAHDRERAVNIAKRYTGTSPAVARSRRPARRSSPTATRCSTASAGCRRNLMFRSKLPPRTSRCCSLFRSYCWSKKA